MVEMSFSYSDEEKHFIDYFNRLYSIGKTYNEIYKVLPSLEKLHTEIVKTEFLFYRRSLTELFKDWKHFNEV